MRDQVEEGEYRTLVWCMDGDDRARSYDSGVIDGFTGQAVHLRVPNTFYPDETMKKVIFYDEITEIY